MAIMKLKQQNCLEDSVCKEAMVESCLGSEDGGTSVRGYELELFP